MLGSSKTSPLMQGLLRPKKWQPHQQMSHIFLPERTSTQGLYRNPWQSCHPPGIIVSRTITISLGCQLNTLRRWSLSKLPHHLQHIEIHLNIALSPTKWKLLTAVTAQTVTAKGRGPMRKMFKKMSEKQHHPHQSWLL